MRVARLLPLPLIALAAAVPSTASATFPGRNGDVAYGLTQFSDTEQPEFPVHVREGIAIRGLDDESASLIGCDAEYLLTEPNPCRGPRYTDPTFSPDGTRVLFDAGAVLGISDADARGPVRLLLGTTDDDGEPAFSPDGTQIVFVGRRDEHAATPGIWIRGIYGAGARRLTRGTAPAWSTRGWIAFRRTGAIYRIRPHGRHATRLARSDSGPSWSPDGRRIAFSRTPRYRDGKVVLPGGVFVMNADGSGLRRVIGASRVGSGQVVWSPDGHQLLLVSIDLWTMDLRGGHLRTHGETEDVGALHRRLEQDFDWQPLR
jgi:Tol biopolymer transport system component